MADLHADDAPAVCHSFIPRGLGLAGGDPGAASGWPVAALLAMMAPSVASKFLFWTSAVRLMATWGARNAWRSLALVGSGTSRDGSDIKPLLL